MTDSRDALRRYYQENADYCDDLARHDAAYHAGFMAFVARWIAPDTFPRVLDLGCGTAASTACLRAAGYHAFGSDLSPLFLARGRGEHGGLPLAAGDAYQLPYDDATFDAVVSYEFIEHVPDVPAVLREMARVARPGGRVLISSPNLCSPLFPLADLLRLLRGGAGRPVFAPTLSSALAWFFRNSAICAGKMLSRRARFLYREPDLSGEVIGGDADSVYLAHPLDLSRELARLGCKILAKASGNRPATRAVARICPAISPFIGVVADKR